MTFIKVEPPFNIERDFWTLNPMFKYIEPYSVLYRKDRSRDKRNSSKTMWCIWMLEDPTFENPIRLDEDKMSTVKSYYNVNEEDELFIQCREDYYNRLSPIAKSVIDLEKSLLQRRKVITKLQQWFVDNIDNSPPMVKLSQRHWHKKDKILVYVNYTMLNGFSM